ncbi:MAG: T9SS type A sorting domain-containing protein [Parabacteroides sp.]|nr:T9SS type A sorting domain-containing protein [Parabacteroides sp.]
MKGADVGNVYCQIVNINGIPVYKQSLLSGSEIVTPILADGVYVVTLYKEGKVLASQKVSVR